jgi:aryl-alcohol dehydrogenase-like predicted oxidoreductase
MTRDTKFSADDHRAFNRRGESFDRGETFSGLDFDLQLALVDRLKPFVPPGATLAQFALRWILDFEAVTTVIPGGRRVSQVDDNVRASDLARLSEETHARIAELYARDAKPHVHNYW